MILDVMLSVEKCNSGRFMIGLLIALPIGILVAGDTHCIYRRCISDSNSNPYKCAF
jgi:hypothetical protein